MEVVGVIGAKALDTLLGELLKVVVEAKDRAIQYGDILARVERKLRSITPIVEEISRCNAALHRSREEVQGLEDILRNGKIIIENCLNDVKWWNCCYTRPVYAGDLLELEASLREYMEATLLKVWRDVLKILAGKSGDHPQGAGFGIGGHGTCAVPEEPRFAVGLEVHVEKIRKLLLTNDSGMIVVSAPGGYGKTTLVNKLCHDKKIKSRFDKNVLYVPVSSKFNVKIIIKDIFRYLEQEAPEFRDDSDAIDRFRECLSNLGPPVLLVLDDVWAPEDWLLEKLNFPNISDYKILVTSRYEFPGLKLAPDSTYRLQELDPHNAENLFRNVAGLPKENSNIQHDLVKKMVEFCKGLPLALSVVGRSLRGKPPTFWRKTEKEWLRGVSVLKSEEGILLRLRLSLDVLDDEVKKCFLDMSSIPEDKRIPVTALIDMWEELYGPEDDDGVSAMAHIYNLCYHNLARLIVLRGKEDELDSDDYYNGLFVTQHDLLRELAIQESRQGAEQNRERLILNLTGENSQESECKNRQSCCITSPFPCTDMKHQRNRARLLSISTDQKFSSNWPDMQAPEAEVLVLNIWSGNFTHPNFLKKMKKLKVLMATNYGFHPTSIANFQVIASLSALRRIRLKHVTVPCLGSMSVKLENLKKISFGRCKLDQAFTNRDMSIAHVFPNLVEISIEYSDELLALPENLCDLVHLKRLSITNCHKLGSLPEGIGKLVNLETLRLSCCFDLPKLPESIGNLHKLQILDISRCFSIERLLEQVGQLRDLRKLDVESCRRLRELPSSFQNRHELEKMVCICDVEREGLWRSFRPKPTIKIVETNHSLDWLYL